MIRGTTAQFRFKIAYDIDFDDNNTLVKVVFWQPGNDGPSIERALPIVKCIKNETCIWQADTQEIIVTLHPEETARFVDDRKAYVQLSVTTESGFRFASGQQLIKVYPMYSDSPLGDVVASDMSVLDGTIILDGGRIG